MAETERVLKLIRKDIITGDDGFKIYWPEGSNGAYNSHLLRLIADELDTQNKEWDKEVNDYFNKENDNGE